MSIAYFQRPTMTITVPEEAWEPSGPDEDERGRLLATLFINGVAHHLEAFGFHWEGDEPGQSIQEWDVHAEDVDLIYRGVGADGPWESVVIAGRRYVVVASPFCD